MTPPSSHTKPHPNETLDKYITKSHYDRAINRAPFGKAPGPDAITNELIKYLPEEAHALICKLFQLMAKHNYTPREWCKSATCLLYKPNKKEPQNIACYRSIALMDGIPKLWTSILTNIGSPWAEAQGILSDTADGFRRHIKIYDSLSTHVMVYEDARLSKKHIYTVSSYFKRAFRGMEHRILTILFETMRKLGFQDFRPKRANNSTRCPAPTT
jgi:hypothetical protein